MFAQLRAANRQLRAITHNGLPDYVCHYALLHAFSRVYRNHRLRHSRVFQQRSLDFSQLNPVATDLHLVIIPSQEFDRPILRPRPRIPSPVDPITRFLTEWIWYEAFRGQLRSIVISACYPCPADIQLSGHSHWHWLTSPVQNVNLRVRDRLANWNWAPS